MLNILVADDDQDDQDLFLEAIAEINPAEYNVIAAKNGLETMDYLLKRDSFKETQMVIPDFIVLDLNMPLKDGFDTLKEIKNTDAIKKIPVYILTTSWTETHVQKCRALGASGYFTKPSRITDLKASIQKMILDL